MADRYRTHIINSKIDDDLTISIQVVNYTDNQRMVIGRDISRLVKVNQIQSDFVANVSHELKTPLTVLKGYIEILQNNPNVAAELEKPLEQMATQSERMEYIVQDLLYLAKLENKDDQTSHEPVDITNIINTIVETVNDRIHEKQLKLELDIDYTLSVFGSHTELHAAFSNLIFNAVNYTPKQGIIRVSWKADEEAACTCLWFFGAHEPCEHPCTGRICQCYGFRKHWSRARNPPRIGDFVPRSFVVFTVQIHFTSIPIVDESFRVRRSRHIDFLVVAPFGKSLVKILVFFKIVTIAFSGELQNTMTGTSVAVMARLEPGLSRSRLSYMIRTGSLSPSIRVVKFGLSVIAVLDPTAIPSYWPRSSLPLARAASSVIHFD